MKDMKIIRDLNTVKSVYELFHFLDENYNTGSSYNPFDKIAICMGSNYDGIKEVVINWALENGFEEDKHFYIFSKGNEKLFIYKVSVGIRIEYKRR